MLYLLAEVYSFYFRKINFILCKNNFYIYLKLFFTFLYEIFMFKKEGAVYFILLYKNK